MSHTASIILLVIVTSIANVLGGALIVMKKSWSDTALNAFMAIGAGFLLSIGLLDLLPESLQASAHNIYFALIGFLVVYLFQNVISTHFHFGEETHEHEYGSRIGIYIGMLTHTFFDGVAVASGFEVDIKLGILVFFAVLLHKIPDGLTIASVTLAKNGSRKRALLASAYLGVSTLLGGLVIILLGKTIHLDNLVGVALAFSSGVFLYVACTDLLPAVNRTENRKNSLFVFLGIALFLFSSLASQVFGGL
ncbi:ZIP family metal transporter [Effusibacillus dendaii]|uniref:Divalent cation transporter n=1 Tax=Effusibacillus dendaii TaxID=2743772 RepID=A0A7I8D888_9BACL|nr:ZIP family metal transporter [Effusibacillus dendaii]BCJ86363.1 divalent cation transporter [Effusibacillus dendaii]